MRPAAGWERIGGTTSGDGYLPVLSDIIANSEEVFTIDVGSEEKIAISTEPVTFVSRVTYTTPKRNTLAAEAELVDIGSMDDIDEALIDSINDE